MQAQLNPLQLYERHIALALAIKEHAKSLPFENEAAILAVDHYPVAQTGAPYQKG